MFYHHVLAWKACYTSFTAVLCKPTSRTAREVSKGNKEAADIAKQVYTRFTESSETISKVASEFKSVIDEMKPTVKEFKEASKQLSEAINMFRGVWDPGKSIFLSGGLCYM